MEDKEEKNELRNKRIISNLVFWIATGNVLLFVAIKLTGCMLASGIIPGDRTGWFIMLYTMTIFVPQILFFIVMSLFLIYKGAQVIRKDESKKPSDGDWALIGIYFFVVFIASQINCLPQSS